MLGKGLDADVVGEVPVDADESGGEEDDGAEEEAAAVVPVDAGEASALVDGMVPMGGAFAAWGCRAVARCVSHPASPGRAGPTGCVRPQGVPPVRGAGGKGVLRPRSRPSADGPGGMVSGGGGEIKPSGPRGIGRGRPFALATAGQALD